MKDFLNNWFSKINISYSKKKYLLEKYKSIEIIWNCKINELKKENNYLDEHDLNNIYSSKLVDNLIKEVDIVKANNIGTINILDEAYPKKLKYTSMPPLILFYKGNIELCNEASIGVIGTRNATEYGKKTSMEISKYIADNEIVVVSGMAYGIDMYAHMGAIRGKSHKTIAVLGNGLLECDIYPKVNIPLFNSIYKSGGLVLSEYPIYTKASKEHFPARNRIIAGLSDKVIVVEAGLKSGSFITVDYALEYGKEVFAVPGGIYSSKSIGCNYLIKEGANVVCNIKDIL